MQMFIWKSASVNNAGCRCSFSSSTAGIGLLFEQIHYSGNFLVLVQVVSALLAAAVLAFEGCLSLGGWQCLSIVCGPT